MYEKLIAAAKAAKDTAPVETRLYFDMDAVHIEQRCFIGNKQLAYETAVPWHEIFYAKFPAIEFHIKSGREVILAEWEGPNSTNPNRER